MFEEDYVQLVIAPKLHPIIATATSLQEVCREFEAKWGYPLNRSRALRWLGMMGVTPRKQTLFLGAAPTPVAAVPVDDGFGPGPELPPPRDLAGQVRFPFMDAPPPAGMFANVQMPGFSE